MQFAIGLLLVLTAACTVGSVITQGQSYEAYAKLYGERWAGAIMALQLDDLFHSWWFILLSAFLCLNLLLCNLIRMPSIIRIMKREADPAASVGKTGNVSVAGIRDVDGFFKAMGFSKILSGDRKDLGGLNESREPDEAAGTSKDESLSGAAAETAGPDERKGSFRFSVRNTAGLWGAWVCHLGILLLILGFGLGQATKQEYTVYGLPGDSMPVGDTGCVLTIDSFEVGLREDDTVEQYTAGITVRRPSDGALESAEISVNNPASIFGMRYYQNSTGWAADIHITKNGEPLQDDVIYAGDYVRVADMPDLVIYLNAFYPDYVLGESGPMSISSSPNNPAYLYSVYYKNQMLGMNALLQSEELTIDDYTVTFGNPRNYTLIQVKRDRFTFLALIGGLVVMLGLILAFYLQEARMWAEQESDGTWTVHAISRKGGVLFGDRFRETAEKYL